MEEKKLLISLLVLVFIFMLKSFGLAFQELRKDGFDLAEAPYTEEE